MISEELKCIYIHIPKTAGTSVEQLLGHFSKLERGTQDHRTIREIESLTFADTLQVLRHEGAIQALREIRGLARYTHRLPSKTLDKYFKFTFVRNPWARVYSWYRNVMRDEHHRTTRNVPKDCTFEDFLTHHSWHTELRPQLCWITGRDQSIKVDYIGRFEHLSESMGEIAQRLGLPSGDLPHLIKGDARDYQAHYNDVCKRLVEQRYADEIKLFQYTFAGE